MRDCEFLEKCPISAKFKIEDLKNYWVFTFCKGSKQTECARKVLRKQGKEVPKTMLPSGQLLEVLDK
jgi:hypothetical protein